EQEWLPAPAHCRRLLQELVAHELAPLRAREAWLREHVEAPARAVAREQARGPSADDLATLRAERLHEQAVHPAPQALLSRRPHEAAVRRPAAGRPPAARPRPAAAAAPARPGLIAGAPPRSNAAAHAVFLDYHGAHRAVLAARPAPAAGPPSPITTPSPESE